MAHQAHAQRTGVRTEGESDKIGSTSFWIRELKMKIHFSSVAFAALILLSSIKTSVAFDPACREKLEVAAKLGLLLDMKATSDGMEFVVNEAIWRGMAFRSKQGLVDTINCGLLDEGKQFNPIIFRSDKTNKIIGKQDWGTLTVY